MFQRDSWGVGEGRPVVDLTGAAVNAAVVPDLLTSVRDLAASVIEPKLSRPERISRAERATAAAAGMNAWVDGLNPYRDGIHSRLADMLAVAGLPAYEHTPDPEAVDRLTLARAHDQLQRFTRAASDFSGLTPTLIGAPAPLPTGFPLIDLVATSATAGLGPVNDIPGPWADLPEAAIDSAEILDVVPSITNSAKLPMTMSRWGSRVSRQFIDQPGFTAELELVTAHVVNIGLEQALTGALALDAVAAADLEAAEAAVGAVWAPGADLVLCAGADLPKVRRLYATANLAPADRPAIMGTFGLDAGTALVLARNGIVAETTTLQWAITEAPSVLGRDVFAYRYGRAYVRMAGAVQSVTIA